MIVYFFTNVDQHVGRMVETFFPNSIRKSKSKSVYERAANGAVSALTQKIQ